MIDSAARGFFSNSIKKEKSENTLAEIKSGVTFNNLLISAALLCCLAAGFLPGFETPLSAGLLLVLLLSFKSDDFYIFLAIFLFFLDQFYITSSNPVYRVYTYLMVVKILLDIFKIKIKFYWLPPLAVFSLFSILVVGVKFNMRSGLNLIADVLVVFFTAMKLYGNPELLRKFLFVFSLAALCAGVYSFAAGNVIGYSVGREQIRSEAIVRYCATYSDANYAGFFYNMAIFIMFNLKRVHLPFRLPVLIGLHYFLLLTNSITALACYMLCMAVYVVLVFRKKSLVIFGAGAALFAAAVVVILSTPALYNISFIHNVTVRIREQLRYLSSGRMDMFTSGRTKIWSYFYGIFKNENLLAKLFGGNVVTSLVIESKFTKYFACHQTFLQGLMNWGIIGDIAVFAPLFSVYFYSAISYLKKYFSADDADIRRIAVIATTAWLFFALSIDYFLDWRFMFFYFL